MDRPDLSTDQLDRYARQIVLDGFGAAGQGALRSSSALVVGAGGLGAPVIAYLAGAGIGRLGIADDDIVERSNLHRQVTHRDADIGRAKVDSAADWVQRHNPDVDVDPHETTVDADAVEAMLPSYDLVVDASDRFETRFLLNDACALQGVPLVHGAVYRFEGQVGTFHPAEAGPCYRCLFPEAPPPGTVPDCATAGVLGPVPGTVGAIQASEAIKRLAGIGTPVTGRLLFVDLLDVQIESIEVAPDPDCPVCGTGRTIESLGEVTYRDRCAIDLA